MKVCDCCGTQVKKRIMVIGQMICKFCFEWARVQPNGKIVLEESKFAESDYPAHCNIPLQNTSRIKSKKQNIVCKDS